MVHESSLDEESVGQLNEHAGPRREPGGRAIRPAEAEQVRAAIEAMPEPFREAIVLRDLEDFLTPRSPK